MHDMIDLSRTELLIFDLDGTLVNSQFDLQDAVNYALKKLERPLVSEDQITSMLGGGIRQLMALSLGEADEETLRLALSLFQEYYSRHFADKTRPYHGVGKALASLKGYKKAVLSNKLHLYTTGIIKKSGLYEQFDLVLGAQPDVYPLKPHPGGIAYILRELKAFPERAMMIGDSTHDMEAAQALGLKTCAVTYGYRPAEMLRQMQPDLMIDSMAELPKLLKGG